MKRIGMFSLCILAASVFAAGAYAATPQELFEQGNALLAKGDFDGAFKAYAEAATADRANESYRQQATMVRHAMRLRERMAAEQNDANWQLFASSLRTFYHNNDVMGEALLLDKAAMKRLGTPESAANLAETYLLMNKNEEVVSLAGGLTEEQRSTRSQIYLAIAMAREGAVDRAQEIAKTVALADATDAGLLFDGACMLARIGAADDACAMLVRSFENTAPSLLEGGKIYATSHVDLASLKEHAAFTAALTTKSKVAESKCSGGTGCGKCPSKSACDKSDEKKH